MTSSLVGSEMCIRDRAKELMKMLVGEITGEEMEIGICDKVSSMPKPGIGMLKNEQAHVYWIDMDAAGFLDLSPLMKSSQAGCLSKLGKSISTVSYTHLTLPTICSV
eukprot:1995454-Prorocentrum_lima.AAC.1